MLEPGEVRTRSVWKTAVLLIGLALVVRLGVLAGATAFGPSDSVGDVAYHAELVADPIGHLRDSGPDVSQYAPYLGMVEWVTAKPWIEVGTSTTTALRLSSITWDLIGMGLLLYATVRRFPASVMFVGLMWALSPLVWPASAYSAQDETIAGAIVAGVVVLLLARRRAAAVAVCVLGLFLAKILLLPVVAAILVTVPRAQRRKVWGTAAVTLLAGVAVTWALSGTDGLSQQGRYSTDVIGFSMTLWSTLVLHHYLVATTAIHISIVLVGLALLATLVVWSRNRTRGDLEAPRLAAALLLVAFALLAVSNPEYLCIVAPVAIIGCIGLGSVHQPWRLVVVAGLAWGVNGVYYLLRKAYDPTGSLLGITGIDHPVGGRVHFLDVAHQSLLFFFLVFSVIVARDYVVAYRSVGSDDDSDLILL